MTVLSPQRHEPSPHTQGPRPGSHRSVTPHQVSDKALSLHPLRYLRAVTFLVCFSTATSPTLETTATVCLPWLLPLRSPARTAAQAPHLLHLTSSTSAFLLCLTSSSLYFTSNLVCYYSPNNRLRAGFQPRRAYFYALIFLTPPIQQPPECSFLHKTWPDSGDSKSWIPVPAPCRQALRSRWRNRTLTSPRP